MRMSPHLLVAAAIAASGALTACHSPMPANVASVGATLSGAAEVPPVVSGGSGKFEGSINKDTGVLRYKLTYTGLSGPATAAHVHGPAVAGQNAGVVLPFKAGSSPIEGDATLTAAQLSDLLGGRFYANVHTASNPAGEIRGQVQVGGAAGR